MDNEDLSSDTSCLVDIGDLSELQNVSNEEAITNQGNLINMTSEEDSQSSANNGDMQLKEETVDQSLEVAPDAASELTIPLEKEDEAGVEYHIDPSSEGYIILSQDCSSNLGVLSVDDEESGEPAPKRLHLQGENGQSYFLTVSDSTVAVGSTDGGNQAKHFLVQMPTTSKAGTQNACKKSVQSDVNQAWFTTRDDKQALQSTGASWKQGQWTKEEIDILQNNINNYCKENDIGDPTEIIFEMSKDERKDFYRTIAKGLQRPLFSVYRRVTRMYDQKNYIGKYTPEEIQKLKELRGAYGNDWASIGQALGRSASSVKDKCRLMKDTCSSGKWMPSEEKLLCNAVYELTGAKQGENVTSGLSWALVAEKVGTRSEKQCRTKWLNYMNWKQKGGVEWTREDDINLILTIADLGVFDDTEIDWSELSKNWSSVRSPQWLRGKWWSLKRHVPDYKILPFTELLEHLKTSHLQQWLGRRVGSMGEIVHSPLHAVKVKGQIHGATGEGSSGVISLPLTENVINVPVAIHSGDLEKGEKDTERLQAYETSVGTFLITQPQNNPAIAIQGTSLNTDHIIVHTLPATSLHSVEGMTVQLNAPSVIFSNSQSSGEVSLDSGQISADIKLTDDVGGSEQELKNLTSSAEDIETENLSPTSEMIETEAGVSKTDLSSETQEMSAGIDNQALTVSDIESDVSQSGMTSSSGDVGNLKLILVTSGNGETTEFITSLTDPMLPSGSNDFSGSPDDREKPHHHDNTDTDTDITSVDISETAS